MEGSLEEVTHKLHEIGDYSQVSSPFSSTLKESSSVMSFLDTSMAYFSFTECADTEQIYIYRFLVKDSNFGPLCRESSLLNARPQTRPWVGLEILMETFSNDVLI